jgi:hypothetical protein
LLASGQAAAAQHTVRIGSSFSVLLHVLITRLFDAQGFGSKYATKRFLIEADKFGPDIIHLHNLHGSYIHLPSLFQWLKEKNKPVIWTLQDCWPLTGHCSNTTASETTCDKWKIGCAKCPQKHADPKSWLIDRSSLHFFRKRNLFTSLRQLTIAASSPGLFEQVRESFLSKYQCTVIPSTAAHYEDYLALYQLLKPHT